jgi:hypothetical protein
MEWCNNLASRAGEDRSRFVNPLPADKSKAAAKPPVQKSYALLSDIQIAGIMERLKLSPAQEQHWPGVESCAAREKITARPFLDKTGIIAWRVNGWTDATGHFTLWDGQKGLYVGGHSYFDMSRKNPDGGGVWLTKAELWKC